MAIQSPERFVVSHAEAGRLSAYQPRQRTDLSCSGGGPTGRVDYFRTRRPVWGLLGGLWRWRRTQPSNAFHGPITWPGTFGLSISTLLRSGGQVLSEARQRMSSRPLAW